MITIEVLLAQETDLAPRDLERWIAYEWVKPDRQEGRYVFRDIDVARVRLIRELRDDLDINETALPVVLLLLDQLYDLRRQLKDLQEGQVAPRP